MDGNADWRMLELLGGAYYHEDWAYDHVTDEQTQQEFVSDVGFGGAAALATEIRRLWALTSSPVERRATLIELGNFSYGCLPDDPDAFLTSWLRASEAVAQDAQVRE